MAAKICGYKALMEYRGRTWHVDYENTYPDVEFDIGECRIKVIYGDCNHRALQDAMKSFAANLKLKLNFSGVKLVREGPQS